MDQQSKKAPGLNAIVPHLKQSNSGMQNDSVERRDWIAEIVAATVEAMGTELSAPALNLFVTDLLPLSEETIMHALTRCRREIRGKNGFPPTLTIADVLDRAGVVAESAVDDAEWRAAWDVAVRHADKYIISNAEGGYEEKHYFGETLVIPGLAQRIGDTVRRIGGWRAIKCMSNEDFPFVQKRFCEEYRAWAATEQASMALLGEGDIARLVDNKPFPENPSRKLLRRVIPGSLVKGRK